MDIKIVEAEKRHLPEILEMEKEGFSVPWSEKSFLFEMDSPDAIFLVAEDEGKTAGLCVLHCFCDDGEIFNIVVRKASRRKKLGNMLLNAALAKAKEKGIEKFYLEVRESNSAAIGLYGKNGFLPVGRRKNYYDGPREDALIYMLDLTEKEDEK